MKIKTVQFFYVINVHPLLFARPIKYLHCSIFVNDSVLDRWHWNEISWIVSQELPYILPRHRSFIFLISVVHKTDTPASVECRANVIRSLHPLWQNAWTKTRRGGKSQAKTIIDRALHRRRVAQWAAQKEKKIGGKYASQRGLHPLLRRRRRQRGCACIESPCTRCTVLMPGGR